ncbi:paramyosin-like [Labrus mixtus]|uniref:paramyosin-like n=1 Tax=Labrus mixtus TaxID=508554 RepID=UPI0029C0ADD2|nr:paramyosin-like [Labrus mixtus]
MALKDHIAVQQEESLEKDNTIRSLCVVIENLRSAMGNRDEMVSCLQDKVKLLASDLEASFSQQHKEAERLSHLTQENQKLVSENERLQSELQSALLALKELQEEETGGSRSEEEHLRAQVADLMKSQTELLLSKEELKGTVYDMTAELEGKNTIINNLKNNLEACHIQQERSEELYQLNCAEQQEDSLQKDKEIGSLHFNIQTLLTEAEDRDNTVSALEIKVKQLASDLEEEQAKNSSLQRDLEAAQLNCAEKQQEDSLQKDKEIGSLHFNIQTLLTEAEDRDNTVSALEIKVKQLASDLEEEQAKNSSLQRDLEAAQLNCAEKQQEDSLQKDKEIGSLHFNIQTLLTEAEDRDNTVSALEIKVKQLASDLKEEQAKNSSLQRDLEAAVSRPQKDVEESEELESLTPENEKQASEITRLKGELKAAKLAEEQLQKEGSRRDEENKEQKALLIKARKTLQSRKKELLEKSQALENSLAAEKVLKSALEDEKMCSKRMFSQQQAAPDAAESSKRLMDEVKMLRKENADIRAQLETTFREHQQTKAKYEFLYEHQEQMLSSKTDIISENKITTMNLQIMVEDLKAAQLESRTRQTSLEGALRETREKTCELQQAADKAAAQLETEKTKCFKQGLELQEALIKNNVCLKERQNLLEALQRTQDTGFMQTKQQMQTADIDLRLIGQQVELDQSRTAFRKLHDQHAELGKENSDLKGSYRKLRYAYKDLKVQYKTLCIASDYSQS